VDKHLVDVRERYLGDPADVMRIEQALAEFRATRAQTLELVRSGRRAEAIAQNDGRDRHLGEAVLTQIGVVADFSAAKAISLKRAAEQESRRTVNVMAPWCC
jgi:hypothetical protein